MGLLQGQTTRHARNQRDSAKRHGLPLIYICGTLRKNCIGQLTVIFDGYTTETTKGPEQKRRKKDKKSIEMKVDWIKLIPRDIKSFTSSSNNKQQLVDLFSSRLLSDGINVKQAKGDADMLIVKEVLIKAKDDHVVVHSRDTDVFIALIHHIDNEVHNHSIIMNMKKGFVSVNDMASKLSPEMRICLPFAHAIYGCDTVSATYGIGKLKAFKKLQESSQWRNELKIVGNEDADIEEMINIGERFYLELYGTLGRKADYLDNLREIMYTAPKYIPISRMPPTTRAFRFHMLRAHLETNTYKNLEQRLKPEDHGFERNADGKIIPILTDKPPAPSYLLQEINCGCTKPNKAGMLCTICKCVKAGLECNVLCKCNVNCENDGANIRTK